MGAGDRSAVKVSFLGDAVSLARAAQKAQSSLGEVGTSATKVSGRMKAGMAIGATAVIGFAKTASDKFAEVGGETVRLQRYIGGTVEDASRLRFAATESGVGIDDLTKGLGKFSKALVTAKPEQMSKLGISVRDAHGALLPMSAILPQVAERFKTMQNGPAKTALALQLFGKSGMSLMPFLNKGADGIKELTAESDKFGNTLSSKDTAALKANTIAKRQWHAVITGVQIQLGRGMLPMLTGLAKGLGSATKFATEHSRIIKPLAAILATVAISTIAVNKAMAAGRAIQTAALAVKALFVTTTNAETGAQSRGLIVLVAQKAAMVASMVATGAMTAAQWALNVAMSANPIALVILAVVALIAAIVLAYRHSATFRAIVQGAFHAVGLAFTIAWDLIKAGFGWLKSHWPLILGIFIGPIGLAVVLIARHWDSVVGFVKHLPGRIAGAASGMWDGIKNAFRSAINWIINAWNGLEFKLPTVDTHIPGIGKVGGFSLGTPNIPQLASGAIVKARSGGTLVNVGEGGSDEAVIPLDRRGGGGGSDRPLTVNLVLDGKVIHTALLNLKDRRGGELGLA
jgi:hypothetical protein